MTSQSSFASSWIAHWIEQVLQRAYRSFAAGIAFVLVFLLAAATYAEDGKFAISDFPSLKDGGEIMVWTEIEFTAAPVKRFDGGDDRFRQMNCEFRVLRVFGNRRVLPCKSASINFVVIQNVPNKAPWIEKEDPHHPSLRTMPKVGDKAVLLLRVIVDKPQTPTDEDPFAPEPPSSSTKVTNLPPQKFGFSHHAICLSNSPRYANWLALGRALDEVENGDLALARTLAYDVVLDPPRTEGYWNDFASQATDDLLRRLQRRDNTTLREVATQPRFDLANRLHALKLLVGMYDPWMHTQEFEDQFLRTCDEYNAASDRPINESPVHVFWSLFAATRHKELSTTAARSMFAKEMDPARRDANARAIAAIAIVPYPDRADFLDRLEDCLNYLKVDPDEMVRERLTKCIEHIKPLSDSARAQIERTLPDLPKTAADRLREWIAKQKPQPKP